MSVTSISLFDGFSSVPDPRSVLGKRHPLSAILTLCSVAMLCGCRSLFAIAQFGRDVTMGEDACRVRKRSAPVIFSTLRNGVLGILQTLNVKNRAAQFRTFCANPVKALQALKRKITEN